MKVLNKETVKQTCNAIVKTAKEGCKMIPKFLTLAVIGKLASDRICVYSYDSEVGYDDAISAIMKSGMWSEDKAKAAAALKTNGDSAFYAAVINIVQSSMWSEDKVKTITEMSNN